MLFILLLLLLPGSSDGILLQVSIRAFLCNTVSKNYCGIHLGTVQVDFYRTYQKENRSVFFRNSAYDYSISKRRIRMQLKALNAWFEGRVHFVLGDIFDIDKMHIIEGDGNFLPCSLISEFARSTELQNRNRISIVISKSFGNRTLFGCANGIDVPLRQPNENSTAAGAAPAAIMTMSNGIPGMSVAAMGLPAIAGWTLAHEIGHLVGLSHTAGNYGYVNRYTKCGLDLRYPTFNRQNLTDDTVFDFDTNTTFNYKDWKGRSNIMASFQVATHLPELNSLSIFQSDYADVFAQIIECWFNRSATF